MAVARFRITLADLAAAQRAHLRWRLRQPRLLLYVVLLGGGFCLMEILSDPSRPLPLLAAPLFVVTAGSFVLYAVYYAAVGVLSRSTFRRTKAYHEEWEVALTRAGVRARTASVDNFVSWGTYVAWRETGSMLLLYQNNVAMQFIPKASVSPDFVLALRTLAASLSKR